MISKVRLHSNCFVDVTIKIDLLNRSLSLNFGLKFAHIGEKIDLVFSPLKVYFT